MNRNSPPTASPFCIIGPPTASTSMRHAGMDSENITLSPPSTFSKWVPSSMPGVTLSGMALL